MNKIVEILPFKEVLREMQDTVKHFYANQKDVIMRSVMYKTSSAVYQVYG